MVAELAELAELAPLSLIYVLGTQPNKLSATGLYAHAKGKVCVY